MSIVFSDSQLKATSSDILLIPFLINNPVSGYIAQKNTFQTQTNITLADDTNKANFYNFWKSVVDSYNLELSYLNGVQSTAYSDSDLIDAGNQTGSHYPTSPIWTYISPKKIDSMSGLPISAAPVTTEPSLISEVQKYAGYLKTGFTDGANSVSFTGFSAGSFTAVSGGIPIGHKFIAYDGTHSVFGIVTNIVGSTYSFTTYGGGSVSGSGTAVDYHVGFSNVERAHSSTNYAVNVQTFFETSLDSFVASWKANFDNQKVIIDLNGDYNPRKALNSTASANIFSASLSLGGWIASSYNTRFTNTIISLVEATLSSRSSQIPTRLSDITTNLGSVSQTSGVYSGSGAYFDLAKIIDIRVSRTGSLCKYNTSLQGLAYFDKLILDSNIQLAQYSLTMLVKKLTVDAAISDISVSLADVTGLSVGDSVKLFDNNSNVYVRTIDYISGMNVTLNSAMVAPISIANMARLTKEL